MFLEHGKLVKSIEIPKRECAQRGVLSMFMVLGRDKDEKENILLFYLEIIGKKL